MRVLCFFVGLFLCFQNSVVLFANESISKTSNGDSNKQTSSELSIKQKSNINDTNKKQNSNRYHIVQAGENIYRISLKYNIKRQDLITLNGIKSDVINVGQKLLLPETAVIDRKNDKEVDKKQTSDTNNDDKNVQNTQNNQNAQVKAENKNSANESLNNVVNANSNEQQKNLINKIDTTTFIWPSRGVILSKFGHQTRTGKLEGVNIGVETGSAVIASSAGVVVYSDKVVGYDNVILIRHYNGFFTAYGHTDPVVVVGDKVKKGQIIAYASKNQQSKRSSLYFSIRKNGKSYDPEKVISTKISN